MRHAFGVDVEGSQGVPAGVGRTALAVAVARAIESSRSDRLFDDPFAQDFFLFFAVSAQPRPESSNQASIDLWTSMGDYVALRTRFLDDFLTDSCQAGCRQVVVLGAGLDARAYRLSWPDGVRLFELDSEDVLSFKERVISGEAGIASVSARRHCGRSTRRLADDRSPGGLRPSAAHCLAG